jgi:hypothetical protein
MDDTPIYRVPVPPPPPPAVAMIASVILALIASILGFMGLGFYAGLAAAGSFAFGVAEIFRRRGTVEVPISALNAQGGRLMVEGSNARANVQS